MTLPYCQGSCNLSKNVFSWFHDIIAHFKHIKHNYMVHLSFKYNAQVKQCTMCQHTNYHNTTKHRGNLPWLELLWSGITWCDTHYQLAHMQILKNFWLTLVFISIVSYSTLRILWEFVLIVMNSWNLDFWKTVALICNSTIKCNSSQQNVE